MTGKTYQEQKSKTQGYPQQEPQEQNAQQKDETIQQQTRETQRLNTESNDDK